MPNTELRETDSICRVISTVADIRPEMPADARAATYAQACFVLTAAVSVWAATLSAAVDFPSWLSYIIEFR